MAPSTLSSRTPSSTSAEYTRRPVTVVHLSSGLPVLTGYLWSLLRNVNDSGFRCPVPGPPASPRSLLPLNCLPPTPEHPKPSPAPSFYSSGPSSPTTQTQQIDLEVNLLRLPSRTPTPLTSESPCFYCESGYPDRLHWTPPPVEFPSFPGSRLLSGGPERADTSPEPPTPPGSVPPPPPHRHPRWIGERFLEDQSHSFSQKIFYLEIFGVDLRQR